MICYDCAEYGHDVNEDEPREATQRWDNREVHYWIRSEPEWLNLCDCHYAKRDNAEPDDPDGEAFRGGEAAAYQAEQMTQAQRLK